MKSLKVEIIIILLLMIVTKTFSQTDLTDESSQYLFKSFSKGTVFMKDNTVEEAIMNYNTLSQSIVFEKNGELLNLTNLNMIETIFLHDRRFIPIGKTFYELIETKPLPLFIQYKGKLQPPGTMIGYGIISQVATRTTVTTLESKGTYYNLPLAPDYNVKITPIYWLMKDGDMVRISNTKELEKLFPKRKGAINKFIKKEDLKLNNKEDLIKILRFCVGDSK